jgi:hypothetical protein
MSRTRMRPARVTQVRRPYWPRPNGDFTYYDTDDVYDIVKNLPRQIAIAQIAVQFMLLLQFYLLIKRI